MVAYFTNCIRSCFLFVLKYIDKCFIVLMWIYLGYFLSFAFTYTDTHKAPIMALHVGVVLHMYMYSPRSVISFSKVFYVCMLSLLCFALLLPNCLPSKWRDSVSSLSSVQCIITFQIFVNHTHENKNLQMILIYISQIMSETDHLLFI